MERRRVDPTPRALSSPFLLTPHTASFSRSRCPLLRPPLLLSSPPLPPLSRLLAAQDQSGKYGTVMNGGGRLKADFEPTCRNAMAFHRPGSGTASSASRPPSLRVTSCRRMARTARAGRAARAATGAATGGAGRGGGKAAEGGQRRGAAAPRIRMGLRRTRALGARGRGSSGHVLRVAASRTGRRAAEERELLSLACGDFHAFCTPHPTPSLTEELALLAVPALPPARDRAQGPPLPRRRLRPRDRRRGHRAASEKAPRLRPRASALLGATPLEIRCAARLRYCWEASSGTGTGCTDCRCEGCTRYRAHGSSANLGARPARRRMARGGTAPCARRATMTRRMPRR